MSHDRDLAFGIADRMAMMFEGELRVVGTPEQIRQTPDPIIQKFLHADFKLQPQ